MVINKRIITLTLIGLMAQPALSANKAMRLAQLASMTARKNFSSLALVKPVLKPAILESEVAAIDAFSFNANLREFYTNQAAQKNLFDLAQYVAEGAKSKSAHGIFAATVAAATAATMANEIGKEKANKKARLQQSIALDQTRLEEFNASLPMIQQQAAFNSFSRKSAKELKEANGQIALLREKLELLAAQQEAQKAERENARKEMVLLQEAKEGLDFLQAQQQATNATKNSSSWLRQARQTTNNWVSQVSNWWYKGAKTPNAQS